MVSAVFVGPQKNEELRGVGAPHEQTDPILSQQIGTRVGFSERDSARFGSRRSSARGDFPDFVRDADCDIQPSILKN